MNTNRQRVLAELRLKIHQHECQFPEDDTISTGSDVLDRLFPGRGIRRGTLVEWVGTEAGGAGTLSLWVARQILKKHRPAVVIDPLKQVYPLTFLPAGTDPASLILVRPGGGEGDRLWAIEQALRCEAVSIVWGSAPHLPPVAFRRFKLAAEQSGSVGFFLRSAEALEQPTWADVRLIVEPRPAPGEPPCFRVRPAYSRGPVLETSVDVQIDVTGKICGAGSPDEKTPVVPLVS
jgi:protein ImuA